MRNKTAFFTLLILLILFVSYKFYEYKKFESQLSVELMIPDIKLSRLVNISERRIDYRRTFFINKKFCGFTAYIDEKYFITVTKLGKIDTVYKIQKTSKPPNSDNDEGLIVMDPPSFDEDICRSINVKRYPFNINEIYYYIKDGYVIGINTSMFYEIEAVLGACFVSFRGEDRKDFGFVSFHKKKPQLVSLNIKERCTL